MADEIKRSDQIRLMEACAEFEKTGSFPPMFSYPNCGWDLVRQGLVTQDRKLTVAGKAALWFLDKGEDPTDGGSSISFSIPLSGEGSAA
jgi:hypothetical protein